LTREPGEEPLRIDGLAPRYAPSRALPDHRYVPGKNARPEEKHERGLASLVPPERLHETELFRYGVDLFNRSFFWEAHEAWETLWQDCPEGPVRQALQGLIQLAAANLKEVQGVPTGASRLADSACKRLEVAHLGGARLGIDLDELTRRARTHFVKASKGISGELGAPSPGIRMFLPP